MVDRSPIVRRSTRHSRHLGNLIVRAAPRLGMPCMMPCTGCTRRVLLLLAGSGQIYFLKSCTR